MKFQFSLLVWLVLLVVVSAQDKIIGIVGKDVQLSCDLPRSNPPQIKWKDWVHNTGRYAQTIFDGTTATDKMVDAIHPNKDNLMINNDLSLTIKQLKLYSDPGEYFCISIQGDGSEVEKLFQVDIGALPECSGDTKLSEGETLLLTCQALFSGNSVPQLEWFMGDTQLQSINMDDIGVSKQDYTITGVTHKQDGQTFTCKMVLGNFTEECSLASSVTYFVRDVIIVPEFNSIIVSDEIKCSAKGNPRPVIDLKVTTGGSARVNITEGLDYKAFKVEKELQGQNVTVSCTASNSQNGTGKMINKKMAYTVEADRLEQDQQQPECAGGEGEQEDDLHCCRLQLSEMKKLLRQNTINEENYVLFNTKKNWTEARQTCRSHGADLVSVNNKAEWQILYNLIQSYTFKEECSFAYWTSGHKEFLSDRWVWGNSEEPVRSSLWSQPSAIHQQEDGDGDCVDLHNSTTVHGYRLNDLPCSSKQCFICEMREKRHCSCC